MSGLSKRFTAPWHQSLYFTKKIDVVCPQCSAHAQAAGEGQWLFPWQPDNTFKNVRLTCLHCAFVKNTHQFKWLGPVSAQSRQVCRSCHQAWVEIELFQTTPNKLAKTALAVCKKCGHQNRLRISWRPEVFSGKPVDPFFGVALWYQADFQKQKIWAYNLDHLNYLMDYISSELRERGRGVSASSLITRMPKWMKLAKNRKALLKAFEKLKLRA